MATLALLAIVTGCAQRHNRGWPAVYPAPGFGRVGCFSGIGHNFNASDSTLSPRTQSWLILDSVARSELTPENRRLIGEAARYSTILEPLDTLTWIGADWYRVGRDSIVIEERSTFPGRDFHYHLTETGLEGKAIIISDALNADGKPNVLTWPVRARRVPCDEVPRRPLGWPQPRDSLK